MHLESLKVAKNEQYSNTYALFLFWQWTNSDEIMSHFYDGKNQNQRFKYGKPQKSYLDWYKERLVLLTSGPSHSIQ